MIHISFTDQWQVLLDENGKPLIGRVKFFNADSTQYKSIFYDMQGETQSENPQYTLQDGRLEHQVFIGKGVYTCRVEKFLGTDVSSMRDHANDDTYWQNFKSFKIYGGAEEVEGGSDLAAGFCDTIAALRLVNPSDHGVVSVIGYYSKNDGIEPRTYVWVEGNSDAEDYGSTIVSSVTGYTSAGRWKLCENPIVCATTFGVFPDRSSTITASELSDKATALANYASSSQLCQSVFFKAGHYIFAEGTRLTFSKSVTTGATENNKITFDVEGWESENPPVGTIEILFAGGFDSQQDSPISNFFLNAKIYFGKGVFKTSWLNGNINSINLCSLFSHLTCILNDNKTGGFSSTDKTFKNWKFIGDESLTTRHTIAANTTFKDCSFEGKCFSNCGTGVSFVDCGTINQNQIVDKGNNLLASIIWKQDGSPISTGTCFIVDKILSNISFTNEIDNSVVIPVNGANFITSQKVTLQYFNENWKLFGKVDFGNNSDVFVNMYDDSDDAVEVMLENPKKVLDLQFESIAYTRVLDDTAKTFRLRNGGIFTLYKSGSGLAKDIVKLENCKFSCEYGNLVVEGENVSYYDYAQGEQPVSLNIRNCYVSTAQNVSMLVDECYASGCTFNGGLSLIPNSSNRHEQKFIGCDFNERILLRTASGAETFCNAIITNCNFNISNGGTPIEAISTMYVNGGSFANESSQGYKFENNTYIGDAYLRKTHKVVFSESSTTDGNAESGKIVGQFQFFANNIARNAFVLQIQSFEDYNYIESKLFHLGILDNFTLMAKPLTSKTFYFGQGDDGEAFPVKDYVTRSGLNTSRTIYRVLLGSNLSTSDMATILPSVDWLVEVEKV